MKRKWIKIAIGVALLGGVLGTSKLWAPKVSSWSSSGSNEAGTSAVRYFAVKRGELRVTVTEDGKLRAIKNHPIFPQIRNSLKITWLAAEGALVKKGDMIVTFEKKPFEDQLQTRKVDLE